MDGKVARVLTDKGFGFIKAQDGTEYFFHRSAVEGAVFETLETGDKVSFEEEDSSKGPRANHVKRK